MCSPDQGPHRPLSTRPLKPVKAEKWSSFSDGSDWTYLASTVHKAEGHELRLRCPANDAHTVGARTDSSWKRHPTTRNSRPVGTDERTPCSQTPSPEAQAVSRTVTSQHSFSRHPQLLCFKPSPLPKRPFDMPTPSLCSCLSSPTLRRGSKASPDVFGTPPSGAVRVVGEPRGLTQATLTVAGATQDTDSARLRLPGKEEGVGG